MWVGVDDTDSPHGGCTTWVLTELLALARSEGLDLLGEPRLVRLNPNIPWKTRGNAALSAHFGRGRGPRRRIGSIGGRAVWAYARGRPLPAADRERFRALAWRRVTACAPRTAGTDPAIVVTTRQLPAGRYWSAVREVVPVGATITSLRNARAWWRVRGGSRGLVGATASIAWPARSATWELTAYRRPERWGTPRRVEAASVRAAARRHPTLFLSYDARTRRLLVAPHTPCPILFGLRGTDRRELLAALREIRSEPIDRWVIFRTNQATGDHLERRTAQELRPYTSARLRAVVRARPLDLAGGHVRLEVADGEGRAVECLAFEPTKTLPSVVRALRPGDLVDLAGSRGRTPALRLESVRVLRLAPRWGSVRGPYCRSCARRARSLGRGRGFRCDACRRRWPPESATPRRVPTPELPAWTHPTPSARRHLHPLAVEA